ncbi:MAG: hypothetical protein Q4B86_04800 [Eubacteriales bacterium]|nr:hypothetical protein [Eubacteriales bacterium]
MRAGKIILAAAIITGTFLNPCVVKAEVAIYSGKEITGTWSKENNSGEEYWTFIKADGNKAVGDSYIIDGSKYLFDSDGKMAYSWVDKDGNRTDVYGDDGYLYDAVYYCGDPDDGKVATGWKYIAVNDAYGAPLGKKWFYFGSNGKMIRSYSITEEVDGNIYKYYFNKNGIMESSKWVNQGELEELKGGRWLEHVPGDEEDPYAAGSKRWYFQKESGELVTDRLCRINGKTYLFDSNGIMKTGIVLVDKDNKYMRTIFNKKDDILCESEDIKEASAEGRLMYFDEENGSRIIGKASIAFSDGIRMIKLNSDGAAQGIYQGEIYDRGVMLAACNGTKYEIVELSGKQYLVNTKGKIMDKGEYKDIDDTVYTVVSGSDRDGYTIDKKIK